MTRWSTTLALALAGTGAVLRWSQRNERPGPSQGHGPLSRGWPLLAVALVALDLWLATGAFNPAVDPALLAVEPPSVRFLRAQASQELGRITTFEDATTSKTLNANLGWLLGLQDVRGYDSIIPRQYVQYMQAIEPQGGLLYNRISPFYDPASLTDPRTHLLGVRWVMTELTLDPPDATSDEAGVPLADEDYLILSTMHSAKGQEWTAVFVLNVVDGCIPSDMSTGRSEDIDEERRLCYVGITRAQDRLTLSLALTRMKWGKPRDTIPSRFLFEVTGQAENFAAVAAAKKEAERRSQSAGRPAAPKSARPPKPRSKK